MCGIAGVVQRDGRLPDIPALARALADALAHRGPDGEGLWSAPDARVLLVHRRLAIIDPGPGGAQPMKTPDGRCLMVFNGEVYNYRVLKAELESRGERFTSASDTEVLLRLVARDGPSSLARVRGMFALACWDAAERSLLVARDRFGIKPLYVTAGRQQIAFASELGALARAGLARGEPSPAGVVAFLEWGSVPPPLTWRRGVEMLEPGTWRRYRLEDAGRHEEHGRFADARAPYAPGTSRRQSTKAFCAEVGHALGESVRAHLVADVPVGVFLSGGIDSGALVSSATSAGARDLQTFTVGFDDASSEAGRARLVAQRFGTTHHELHLNGAEAASDLPLVVSRLDQPTIDAVNSYYVSRAVAAAGVKAVLSGAGGDELFGGYPSFTRLPLALRVKRLAGPLLSVVAPVAGACLPARLRNRWRHFASTNGSFVEAYRVQRGLFLPDEVGRLAGPALREGSTYRHAVEEVRDALGALLAPLSPLPEEAPHATVARLESRLYLGSQLLRDLDAMSMAHALEVRVPYVDHELVGVVWPELAVHPELLSGKSLLCRALDRPLPDRTTGHPKQGFTLPFARWMRGELGPFVQEGMRRLADDGWIARAAPDLVWSDWRRGAAHWTRPWALGVLGHFLAGHTSSRGLR